MKSIFLFMGTRPEAIKMAPVARALAGEPGLRPVVVATGQHRQMLHQVLEIFELVPDHDLAVMQPDQSLASLSARLMTAVDGLLQEHPADYCLVQGDTTSAFVGALGAFYRGIPVGHVEAGLRTGDLSAPFPEEANRKLVSALADLHFAPTERARQNLLREGVEPARIRVTGNTVIDALQTERAYQRREGVAQGLHSALARQLGETWHTRRSVLVTGHRRENFGGGFIEICAALAELAEAFPETDFIYPVHLNPNVRGPVHERLGDCGNVRLIEPLGYREFVALMNACTLVLTDSGGIQEEAPGLGKPVLVMRETTERPEGLEAGTVALVGARREAIVAAVTRLLSDPAAYAAMAEARNPYGDGQAAGRIAAALREVL